MQNLFVATITVLSVLGGVLTQSEDKVLSCPPECKCPKETPEKLDCSNAKLTELPTLLPGHGFKEIDLSNNEIKILNKQFAENYETIEDLNLSKNQLTEIPDWVSEKLTSLEHLMLSNNKISDFTNATFVNLKRMCLNNNNLKHLDINSPQLKTLKMRNNSLITLHEHFFSGLPQLEEFDAFGNPLQKKLNLKAFDGAPKLRKVILPNIENILIDKLKAKHNIIVCTELPCDDDQMLNDQETATTSEAFSEYTQSDEDLLEDLTTTSQTSQEQSTEEDENETKNEYEENLDEESTETDKYSETHAEISVETTTTTTTTEEIDEPTTESQTITTETEAFAPRAVFLPEQKSDTTIEPVTEEHIVKMTKSEDNMAPVNIDDADIKPTVEPALEVMITEEPFIKKVKSDDNMAAVNTDETNDLSKPKETTDDSEIQSEMDENSADKDKMAAATTVTAHAIDSVLIGVILGVIVLVAVVVIVQKNWPKIKRSMRSKGSRQQQQQHPLPEEVPLNKV